MSTLTKETKMTNNKMETLVAYVQARITVAEKNEQCPIRLAKHGIDDILKLACIKIDQAKENDLYEKFVQKLQKDKSFKPKLFDKDLPFSLLF